MSGRSFSFCFTQSAAYVLSTRGYSKTDCKESFYLELFWWREQEFTEDPLIKKIVEGGFLDYEAKLSAEELLEMHEDFKPYLRDDWYKTEEWQKLLKKRVGVLHWATGEGAEEFSHFIVGLYEWSSGM
jgi:hypothetical protein